MFYSGFADEAGTDVVRAVSLEIVSARDDTVPEDGKPITFRWVVARKPGTPGAAP